MYNPIINLLTTNTKPKVKFLDFRSSVTDLSTYTVGFENLNISAMGTGGFIASDTASLGPMSLSVGRTMILAIVHTEDAATAFGIASFSIGGINGTELIDRGGTPTNAISTAIYGWDAAVLASASANTNGSIVATEVITSCAVGIISVSNIMFPTALGNSTDTGTAAIPINPTMSSAEMNTWNRGGVVIAGSTLVTATGTEFPDWDFRTNNPPTVNAQYPIQLYHDGNAEIDCSAAYYILPSYFFKTEDFVVMRGNVAWSGTGAGDSASIFLI